jgi:hypothetical protein
MIVIRGFPLRNIVGITLWPFILLKSKREDLILLNHERIHLRQQLELLLVGFYLLYVIEWAYWRLRGKNWWQAYANETNLDYLSSRRRWSFRKYFAGKP